MKARIDQARKNLRLFMSPRSGRAAKAALLLVLTAPFGHAQTAPQMPVVNAEPPALSLAAAYRLALITEPRLAAAKAAAEAGTEQANQARSRLLPTVQGRASRFENRLSTIYGDLKSPSQKYSSGSTALDMQLPMVPIREYLRWQQARHLAASDVIDYERQRDVLADRLATAYLGVASATERVTLAAGQVENLKVQLIAARRLLEGGSGTRTDVDEAQARLDMAVAQQLEASQTQMYSQHQLDILTGGRVGIPRLASATGIRVPIPEGGLQEWILLSENHNPELRAARAKVESARVNVLAAQSEHLPAVDLVAQVSRSDSSDVDRVGYRDDQVAMGVKVSVPLYSGGSVVSATRQAQAELRKAEYALEALARDVGAQVHAQYAKATTAQARVSALGQAVRSARTAQDSALKSYAAGVRTFVDTLEANQRVAAAQMDLSDAVFESLLAYVRLQVLAGRADEAMMQDVSARMAE